jgi:hypothetical protein
LEWSGWLLRSWLGQSLGFFGRGVGFRNCFSTFNKHNQTLRINVILLTSIGIGGLSPTFVSGLPFWSKLTDL